MASDAETEKIANLTSPPSKSFSVDEEAAVGTRSTDDDTDAAITMPSTSTTSKKKRDKTKMSREKLIKYLNKAEKDLQSAKENTKVEKEAKKKLYGSLVKLAQELKKTKQENEELIERSQMDALQPALKRSSPQMDDMNSNSWYKGGLWRTPELLPGLIEVEGDNNENGSRVRGFREEISFTDLFLDLIVVTAFSRVGSSIKDYGLSWPALTFFCIFLQIWRKETAYATRFDNTDLSSTLSTLMNSFAILFGSISADSDNFHNEDSTRIMAVAAFAALLHLWLHLRVYAKFQGRPGVEHALARKYAGLTVLTSLVEAIIWLYGIYYMDPNSKYRWTVFATGILASIKIPRVFLPNDFHAATTKRGVLFILLLGFNLQSLVTTASPFFDYSNSPSMSDYAFMGGGCFLLFCIKLLYCDEFVHVSSNPSDHALLINRLAGFFFDVGQLTILISTTILGSGLDLLTHSYLAKTAAMPSEEPKNLVCLGFGCTILSIAFLKSLSIIRVPTDPTHRRMFFLSYGIQVIVTLATVFVSLNMVGGTNSFVVLQLNDMELLYVLSGLALILVIITWFDKMIELGLVELGEESSYRVHPFGIWWCLRQDNDAGNNAMLSASHPMVRASVSSDRIHLLGGGENEVYEAIRESQNNLHALLAEP